MLKKLNDSNAKAATNPFASPSPKKGKKKRPQTAKPVRP